MKSTIIILFAGILAMITSGATSNVQGQVFLTNEIPKPTDPNFMSFEQFMQYMFYYEQMFGKDYVTKIYKEYHEHDDDDDDDDDDRKKHKKHDKDWWKHNSAELWKDKKKYCEGKGEFKNGKCVTDNDEDKADWEDAVCDNNPKKSKFCDRDSRNKDKEDDEKEMKDFDDYTDEEEEYSNDFTDDNEEEESEEPEEEQEEEQEDSDEDDSGDDSGGDEGEE